MNSKHTPGPCVCDPPRKGHDHINVWEKSGIGHVASVSTGLTPDPSAVSNARLIAAAPKLLEAMMAIEERYLDGCDTYEDWKFMGDTARAALQFLPNVPAVVPATRDSALPKDVMAG